jgi:hypothetical protein
MRYQPGVVAQKAATIQQPEFLDWAERERLPALRR